MTLQQILSVPTAASEEELARDDWDDLNRLSYSADGTKVLDAENFPPEVEIREGCRIICDGVFAFRDYMADTPPAGKEIPLEERSSFLEHIKLPSTITHIGAEAFSECGDLETIKLPAALLFIGEAAFVDCWQLERITLPKGLRVIAPRAFQGCINLYQIKLGRDIEIIGDDAFDDCESLETILIPHGTLDKFLGLLPRNLHKYIEEL